jgi:hypothetical protein
MMLDFAVHPARKTRHSSSIFCFAQPNWAIAQVGAAQA